MTSVLANLDILWWFQFDDVLIKNTNEYIMSN